MTNDVRESIGDVFQDLGFTSGESEKLRIKAKLMTTIESHIAEKGLTQA